MLLRTEMTLFWLAWLAIVVVLSVLSLVSWLVPLLTTGLLALLLADLALRLHDIYWKPRTVIDRATDRAVLITGEHETRRAGVAIITLVNILM